MKWPEGNKPLSMDSLISPIRKAFEFAYKMDRKNHGKTIPWKGPEFENANTPTIGWRLKAANLAYSEEEQNRDALDELLAAVLQVGIEQGRRIVMDSAGYKSDMILVDLAREWVDEKLEAIK